MKKSLVIISFAFIFLLSVSLISASWFNDLFSEKSTGQAVKVTGDVQQLSGITQVPGAKTEISSGSETTTGTSAKTTSTKTTSTKSTSFSRTQTATRGTSSARENQNLVCPRGNVWFKTKDVNGNDCCQRKAGSERSLFGRR